MTSRARIAFEPVEPVGTTIMLVRCPCGAGGRPGGCPNLLRVLHTIPHAETAAAGMALRTYRVSLGLPKTLAAARLGIDREQLDELEGGLARCDWDVARRALRFQERAVA